MPLLAGLLVSMFSGLAGFLATWLTKKIAIAAAAILTFGALTLGMGLAMKALIAGASVAFPSLGAVAMSLVWVALPDNAAWVVATTISADTVIALYRWNVAHLDFAAKV